LTLSALRYYASCVTKLQPKRPPSPFGHYLLLDRVGIGGMAEVWRAKMFGGEGLGQLVAVKRVLPHLSETEEFISMFLDEGRISLQLLHENIAQTYEVGQIGPHSFLSLEYVSGKSLFDLFERGRKQRQPVPLHLACYLIAKACEGLDHAHRKKDGSGRPLNIIHRGLSLQDILVSYEGEVKVIDFGIAKAAGRVTQTEPGIIKGKFGYMSPEQIDDLALDRRSDVFVLGVCLYELITGQRLFVGESDFDTLDMVRKGRVAPPSTHNREIPQSLEQIVLRALSPAVNERYLYASEFAEDLQRFLSRSEGSLGTQEPRQYMRSTFAEDLRREEQRQQEEAKLEPPKDFDEQ
jgi:serine/threonine protein kinase